MRNKHIYSGLASLVLAGGVAQGANILVDSFTDTNANSNNFDFNNLGWHSKAYWADGPSADSLQSLESFGANGGVDSFGIGQTVSVAGLGSNITDLTLSFDWTPDATATQTVSLQLTYQLVAWDTGGASPSAGATMFAGMNFAGTTIGGGVNGNHPAGTVAFDLINGTFSDPTVVNGGSLFEHPSNGLLFPASPTFSSAAGVTSSFSQTFSLNLGGNTQISDYDYVGVRFIIGDGSANSSDPGNDGGALVSNISLDATPVPEPSTVLLGLLGALLTFRRRR